MHYESEKDNFCLKRIKIIKDFNGDYSLNIKISPEIEEIKNKDYLLTSREKEILKLVIQGKNNSEIARELVVSTNTVKAHLSSIFHKLEVKDRVQAAVKAIKENIVLMWLQKQRYVVKSTYKIVEEKVHCSKNLPKKQ